MMKLQTRHPNWKGNKAWYWQWIFAQTKNYNFNINNLFPDKSAKFLSNILSAGSNIASNSHNIILKYNNTLIRF